MVRTHADSSFNLGKIKKDLIPDTDNTRDIGTLSKRWAQIFVVLALVTSITIGTAIKLSEVDGKLFVNVSTVFNGTVDADGFLVNGTPF